MLVALIPNVAEGLDASVAQVAAAITAYMVPFAALQLVSGTLAERLGPRRVVRGGYVAFAAAALACALAPEIWSFLAARAAMGAANAFLSPSSWRRSPRSSPLPSWAERSGPSRRRRRRGSSSRRSSAGSSGRSRGALAFVLVAVVSLVLALPGRRWAPRSGSPNRRAGVDPRAPRPWTALLATQAAGLPGLHRDRLRARPRRRGGVRPRVGRPGPAHHRRVRHRRHPAGPLRRHRRRPRRTAGDGAGGRGRLHGRRPRPRRSSEPWSLGLVFFGIGCASAFVWAGLNTIGSSPSRRTARAQASAYSAFKFAGVAIQPLVYVPLFNVDTRLPFLLAAGFSALLAVSIAPWFGRYR